MTPEQLKEVQRICPRWRDRPLAEVVAAVERVQDERVSVQDILREFNRRAAPETGFYEPHEPAEIIREMLNAKVTGAPPTDATKGEEG